MSGPFRTFTAHGYLAVDLFFVLSGFVMAMNYRHMFAAGWGLAAYLKFLGRRIARVYPLYLVCTVCGCLFALQQAHTGWRGSGTLYKTLLLNLSMVQVWGFSWGTSFDAPAWSISAEWGAYILFPLLLAPTLFRKPIWSWISAVISVLALALLCSLAPVFVPHNVSGDVLLNFTGSIFGLSVLRCVSEFLLGLLAFRVTKHSWIVAMSCNQWAAVFLCLMTLGMMAVPRTDLVVVLLFPLVVLCVASGRNVVQWVLSSSMAEFLGRLSYSIYLTHELLTLAILHVTYKWAARVTAHAHTYALLLVFPVAILAERFIEVPGRRWLRNVFEGNPA